MLVGRIGKLKYEIINLYDEKNEPTYGMTEEQKKEYYDNLFAKYKK